MSNLVIRKASAADVPALTSLWMEASVIQRQLDSRFQLRPDAASVWSQAVSGWLQAPDYCLFVAELEGELLGFIIGCIQSNAPGLLPENTGAVLELAVDAHTTRRGIGQSLITPLIAWFRAQHIDAVIITCPRRHAVEQAFWRAQGAAEYLDILWMKL